MELRELTEPKTRKVLAIFSGGFHPFHAGHASVYQYLRKKFPTADVFVASSNKTTERPFAFKEKQFLASQAGIPADRFVEVTSPYKAMEITQNYNPNDTVLIFALSEKDKDRFGKPLKKDGTPSYFQPFPGSVEKCQPFAKHGYYVVTPTIKFSVLGNNISSASQIREMYKNADDRTRMDIAEDLYPISQQIPRVKKILDKVLGSTQISEHIVKLKNGKYRLLSHKGKNLGTFSSHAAAAKHEGEVEYFKHMKESPDFNYSSFCNRDEELNHIKWQVKKLIPSGEAVTIIATDPETVSSTGYVLARISLQLEEENGKIFRATVRQSGISPNWKGTGLGQMLYDKAIEFAKKKGCKFFCSDTFRTTESDNAWKRLARRYPVEKHSNYYIIDLSKV